ncbi:MAG TPA: protein phosphatase 2C domain-containing protein [Pseudoduganella sp.]
MADPIVSARGVALDIAEMSRIGGRSSNQDACARSDNGALVCLVVADGAGGHEGGEIASALAVQAVIGAFEGSPGCSQALLRALIARATLDVQQQKIGRPQLAAMSATVATVLLDRANGEAAWAHLGDTRIYLFRNGRVLHATRDHSLVQQLIDGGLALGADPRTHKRRNVLYAAIGAESDVPPSIQPPLALLPGDAILICSDGLWEWVTEDVMEACLATAAQAGGAQAWLDALCAAADQASAGSSDTRDNYTAQAVIVGAP